jgi:glycerol transport system ATP-binding protein
MTITLDHVSRSVRGEAHIRDMTVTFEPGTINVLLGPTLSGKTTVMRLLAGLDPPTSGRVLANGRDVTGTAVRERSVAMVYQQFINYPSMTVYENIASPLRVRGAAKEEIDRRVREAAGLLRLEPYLDRMALQLSGGQQQRTAIARALVKDASLVLLDEPLANLDYKLREELRAELPRLFEGRGAVIVYATTEPTEALLLGGNTVTLHQGALTQFGPTPQVYRNPKDRITAQTFSDPPMNFLSVELKAGGARSPGGVTLPAEGVLKWLPEGRYDIGFRPRRLSLERREGFIPVRGVVAVSEITGSESFVHIDVPGERWIALTIGVLERQPGQEIEVYLDPTHFFVFAADGRLVHAEPHGQERR